MKPQKRISHIAALLVAVTLLAIACGGPSPPAAPEPVITRATSSGRDLSTGLSWGGTGRNLKFERISIRQGLSHSTVYCILQDSKGFMWLGTSDGLNKYDGHS
ncbi:MAG: hypothetical protein JSV36_04495, partial [Anaerolineae bacterium]